MKQHVEVPYWITIAHLPKWGTEKINRLIIRILHDNQMNLETFFHLSENEWKSKFELSQKDISDLHIARNQLPKSSFLAEDLLSQGFEVIPINSPEYSKTLKINLKAKASPPVLYVKGNKQILQENSIAIVGSRDADDISLRFTDHIAKLASEQFKVVVSGFAKGVDKQALDSALKYKGQSIIVLPQGIMTFGSGIKKHYKEIVNGDVLVLSTFFPKSVWSVSLAMARNPIIYGLADEIYVAQSSDKGGTWEGVMDGLKKGRAIFVRLPEEYEKNANQTLIEMGAKAFNFTDEITINNKLEVTHNVGEEENLKNTNIKESQNIEQLIFSTITDNALTSKQIIEKINLDWTTKKLTDFLKKSDKIEILKIKNHLTFRAKIKEQEIDEKPVLSKEGIKKPNKRKRSPKGQVKIEF